ncbi:MAG: translocation/assembly module TamB domain-containing protein [Chitinivibrionia bacterium]|nr:translocation/assembly module TamB domain-containing protein [Chitinivibrionia bacterium]
MSERKKRIGLHVGLLLLAAAALGIGGGLLVIKRSSVIPDKLSAYVNEHYLQGTNFTFSCGGMKGDLLRTAVLKDVVVSYRDDEAEFDLLDIGEIAVDYSILDMIRLDLNIQRLSMNDVRVRLRRNGSGALVLPALLHSRPEAPPGQAPNIEIKNYILDDVSFEYRDSARTVEIDDIKMSGTFRLSGGAGRFEIESGRARIQQTETRLQSLRLSCDVTDSSVVLTDMIARLDRSYIMAGGTYRNRAVRHLQFVFNPLDLGEIASLGLFPGASGEIGGNLTLSGDADTLHVRGSVTGKAGGLVLSGFSFSGSLAGGVVELPEVEGTVFGSYVKGMLTYAGGDAGGYAFEGACRGLDISEGFIPASGVPRTDLHGAVRMAYRRPDDLYTFGAVLDSSSIEGFRSQRAAIEGRYTPAAGLSIDAVSFENPGFTLSGSGTIDAKTVADLIFSLEGDDFGYLWDYLKLPRVKSSMHITGRAVGLLDGLRINLNGTIENTEFLFARIDSGVVHADIEDAASSSAVATVDLQGPRIELQGRAFSFPHILLEASGATTHVKDFSFSKGDTLCTGDFVVTARGADQDILFRHLLIKLPSETWSIQTPVKLTVRDSTIAFDEAVLASREGEIRFHGRYEGARRSFDVHAEGREVEASLIQRSLGIPWTLKGKSRFKADWNGTVDEPAIRVDFTLGAGAVKEIPVSGVHFVCEYDREGYRLEHLVVRSNGDSLSGSGAWRLPLSPVRLVQAPDRVERMMHAPWSFVLEASGFPLENVYGALNKKPPLSGLYSGRLAISGSPENARFAARGTLRSTAENKVHFPDISLDAAYEDSLMDINSIAFDDGKFKGSVEGRLPVSFALASGLRMRKHAPFELSVAVSSNDISALATYLEAVELAGGKFGASVNIRGTIDEPRFSGSIDFQDCTLRLARMEETYTKVHAHITLLDNLAQLTYLNGRVGENGSLSGTGSAELDAFKPKRYRIDVTLRDAVCASIHDFISLQDGAVSVVSRGEGGNPLAPVVTGRLQVKQATITKSLAGDGGSEQSLFMPSENPGWYCDLDIEAPKKIFVKNPGLHMELGGNVILKRDQSGLYLRGELNILRGSYALYNNKFTITGGTFNFSTATALRPEINVDAYSLYRMGDEEHRIFLNLSWPKDKQEPQVTLSSDSPQYSETDIWKMMGGTYIASGGTSAESERWDAAGTAQNLASNYLEGVLNAQMNDLTIDVESRTVNGLDNARRPEREMTIAVGKYLSEDLYLKYRQGLSIATEREIDIEYRIGTMVILRSEIIRHSGMQLLGKSAQATDEINFDIKLRFEY